MSCEHCCMSCGVNYKGEHMSKETYQNALKLIADYGDYAVLSGGEPTLHPQFKEFLFMAIENEQLCARSGIAPWLATNGSKRNISMWLAKNSGTSGAYNNEDLHEEAKQYGCTVEYSEDALFNVSLSRDKWHDSSMVHPDVLQAFKRIQRQGNEGIRDVSGYVIQAGHYSGEGSGNCGCSTIQIKPNGDVFACGCNHSPKLGNVNEGTEILAENIELFSELFDSCINYTSNHGHDQEENILLLKKQLVEIYTVREWVADNLPVRRSKLDHPETYRKSLEAQTELSQYRII